MTALPQPEPVRRTSRALLYARTLPTLRTSQVLGRVWRRLRRVRPDLSPAPPARELTDLFPGARRAPVLTGPNCFRLLNREGELRAVADWDDVDRGKLWTYHLHYFDDLNAAGAAERAPWHRDLIERWIAENPPGVGTGWEPYPLSLRLVNWIKWAHAGNELSPAALQSAAVQARYLRRSLETHLLGNHLLANAKALCFAGVLFRGPEADGWLDKGLALLARELPEQVLDDGGHFERSPMYHALVLEDLLDLIALLRGAPDRVEEDGLALLPELIETAQGMRAWLAHMIHPDGEIAFFNDATLGVVPPPFEIDLYARRLALLGAPAPREGITQLRASGYVRMQRGRTVLFADVGELGPRYLPGHAHADTLSFELSFAGRRLIVNSGTSLYEAGEERLRQRSTAAHSTVLVDGEDSSEVWDSFRVARRARPFGLELEAREEESGAGELHVACAHDGYRRAPTRTIHRRSWTLGERHLVVRDRLSGRYRVAEARYFLHPDVRVHQDGEDHGRFAWADGRTVLFKARGARVAATGATWHPGFNLSVPNQCLRLAATADEVELELRFDVD